jgi:uncharacterized membrane protein SpoIIM required for sporulation
VDAKPGSTAPRCVFSIDFSLPALREAEFINRNAARWRELEAVLTARGAADPDRLADLYVGVTDDLAYAATFYPESQTTGYLNQLAARLHQRLYANRREARSRLVTFWTREVPLAMHAERRAVAWSLVVFAIAFGLGVLSSAGDETFVRLILGDSYVDMTLHNVASGDPMAVYKQQHEVDMFLGITFNNVMVSFRAFALGLLAGVGTIVLLVYNGVMIGAFLFLMSVEGALADAMRTVWIHGTLEIAAIVVAGGAGLALGRGMLFPGTLPRRTSFMESAQRGLKIVIGLVPVFVAAGFLEGFVTRHTDMPLALALLVIGGSLAFCLWYFIFLPASRGRAASSLSSTS